MWMRKQSWKYQTFLLSFRCSLLNSFMIWGCFISDLWLWCLCKLNNIKTQCCAEAAFEYTSTDPCFIEATDKAAAHSSSVFETWTDDSRVGWNAPAVSRGFEGSSVDIFSLYHQWLKCSWGRLAIHTEETNSLLPCLQCIVMYAQLVMTYAAIHFRTTCCSLATAALFTM